MMDERGRMTGENLTLAPESIPFAGQRVDGPIHVPARVVAVEAETNASLSVPRQHPAPRHRIDDRLRPRRWNADARAVPRRIGWRERRNPLGFQLLEQRR